MMQYIAAKGGVVLGSGAVILGALAIYGLGITWSCLFAFSLWAVYAVSSRIPVDEIDERNSVENVKSPKSSDVKKKRMLAKKKVTYEMKRKKPADSEEDEDDLDMGLKRSQELVDENMFGNIDYEAAGAYRGVFAMPVSDSGKMSRRNIPSLKSPQPLLYAFHSRMSKREYKQMSPTVLPDSGYPLSPRRSVFDSFQNRTVLSPMNKSWTNKETRMFMTQGSEAQKAISPPGGRYFSRIRHDFAQENRRDMERKTDTSARKDRSLETQTRIGSMGDCYTKEEIVKVLKERTASKRKRTIPDVPDTTVLFEDRYSKKRRLDKDSLDESVTEFKNNKINSSQQGDMDKVEASKGLETPAKSSKHVSMEKKQDVNEVRNKYGLKDNEVESITDDEDMEIDKTQSKRKAGGDFEAKKGKKIREDTANHDVNQTPVSVKKTKKATPVRSIETQTPTKFDDSNSTKSSTRPASTLKTPYKRVFVSGFPSNLKPGSTEKRKKVPIFSGSLGHNENIEIGLEEYGLLGVTSAAYTADKKAAMERVMLLLGGNDSNEDKGNAGTENTVTSVAPNKPDTQPLPPNQIADTCIISTCSTTLSFTKLTDTVPSQLPTLLSATTSGNANASANTTIKLPQINDSTLATASSENNVVTTSTALDNQTNPMISNIQDKAFPLSFGFQAASTTTTTNLISSSVSSSASAVFGQTQQSSITFGGFSIISQSSSTTTTTASSATSTTFCQASNEIPKLQMSQSLALSAKLTAPSQPTQPSISGFGGFNFGGSAASNQQLQSQTNIVKTQPSAEVSKSAIGFSFGIDSAQRQQLQIGSKTQVPLSASTSLSFNSMTKPDGFSFGTTTTSSQTLSSNTFGGFNFGATTTSSSRPSSSTTFGGFNFGAKTTSSSQPSSSTTFGGFNFGSQAKTSANSISVSSSTAAHLGTNLKCDTGKSEAPSAFGGFSFSSTLPSQQPKADIPVLGSLNGSASRGVSSQANATVTPSMFQAPSSTIQLPFGSKTTAPSIATNLFGAPTTSVAFGSQPQFGAGQSNPTGQLFGTPSCSQTSTLFGSLTQSTSSIGPSFGLSSQSSNTVGSRFAPAPLAGNASGSFFSTAPQTSSSNATMLGATSDQNVKTDSMFSASNQSTQQSGLLFGVQPASTAATLFGTQAAASSFSFGAKQTTPAFGSAPNTTSASTVGGGFSFSLNPQSSSTNTKTIAPFGQANNNAFGQFGGQNSSGSNPFASSSLFGQAPQATATTTASGFSFVSASAPSFGQTSSNQSSFGASASTFQPITDQPQAGGFNFAAAAAQKPTSFSFGGASAGGFTSRPGTPTPFNNPPAPSSDIFTSPQPQNPGFALGSGASSRPTVRGRRRARR